jgi:valyl-tRNA synthetase
MRFSPEKAQSSGAFANKLWNASRFVLMNLEDGKIYGRITAETLPEECKWAVSLLNNLAKEANENLEKFEFGLALQKIYDFTWSLFCDWFIEIAKIRLQGSNSPQKEAILNTLVYVLSGLLCLLHPFMPFITETIWQALPQEAEKSVMVAPYPAFDKNLVFEQSEKSLDAVLEVIRAIRAKRSEMDVKPSVKTGIFIATEKPEDFAPFEDIIKKLGFGSDVHIGCAELPENSVALITSAAVVYLPANELVDFEKELVRLKKELEDAEKEREFINGKLGNESFISKAPAAVVEGVKANLAKTLERIDALQKSISNQTVGL